MREILLVRHGRAVEHTPGGDAARALTAEGRQGITAVGHALAALGLVPSLIWHSPFVRAAETAALLHVATGGSAELRAEGALAPGSSPERAARLLLDSAAVRLMVVSHMPLLPALTGELVGSRVEFGTGTVAHIIALGPHGSTLAGLWSSDVLARVR